MSLYINIFQKSINAWDANITYLFNSNRIIALDKTINFLSDLATPMLILAILILFIYYGKNKKHLHFDVARKMLFSFAICASLTFISKNIIHRQRPFKINTEIQKLGSGGSYSFPSGHTADAFVFFLTFPLAFASNPKVIFSCGVWAVFIAYTRLYLGVHFITDILASILLATFSVELYDYLLQKKMSSKTE